jgi:hypothetical protein
VAVPARRTRELDRPARPRPRLAPVPSGGQSKRSRKPRRWMPFLLLSVALVAGVVFLLTGAQALVAQDSFRLSALSARAEEIRLQNVLLRLRVAELSTPDRIAAAGRRSGLVQAGRVEVLGGGR